MSIIVNKLLTARAQRMDARRIHNLIFVGDISKNTNDFIVDVPGSAFSGKSQRDINAIKNLSVLDTAGNSLARWTEDYNVNISNSKTWIKLSGLLSWPNVPRPVQILGGRPFSNWDDAGVYSPIAPSQTSSLGEAAKIAVTGLGTAPVRVLTNIQSSDEFNYAAWALYPPVGKHIYVDPNGTIYLFVSMKYNSSTTSKVVLGKSTTGGKSWSWSQVDTGWASHQMNQSMIADKAGYLHFVWERHSGNPTQLGDSVIMYAKLNTNTAVLSTPMAVAVYDANHHSSSPSIALRTDNLSVRVVYSSSGYGSDPSWYNVISRVVYANGSMSAVEVVTTNASINGYCRYTSISIDKDGYKHVMFVFGNNVSTVFNAYYTCYDADAVWEAPILINSENANVLHYASNILIDAKNIKYISYDIGLPYDSHTSKNPLYIKRIVNGVLGSRVLIQSGAPSMGGTVPTIQMSEDGYINVIFMSNTNPDTYQYRKLSPIDLSVVSSRTLYTVTSGRDLGFLHTPWSIPPDIDNVFPNVPKQGIMVIGSDYVDGASPATANINLFFDNNVIMGASEIPLNNVTSTINIRGSINRTKFNRMANPAIS